MKKITSITLALAIMFTSIFALTFTVVASASVDKVEETAIEIPLTGKNVAVNLLDDKSPYVGYVYCVLEVPEDGTVDITLSTNRARTRMWMWTVDSKGQVNISPFDKKDIIGTTTKSYHLTFLNWNNMTKEAKGVFSYKVTKGTYYLEFDYSSTSPEIYVSAKMRDSKSASSSSSKSSENSSAIDSSINTYVNIKKGSSIQLSSNQSKVTWKSSKESVATVSSSGKVTAKSNGTATITATANGKSTTIKIKVT